MDCGCPGRRRSSATASPGPGRRSSGTPGRSRAGCTRLSSVGSTPRRVGSVSADVGRRVGRQAEAVGSDLVLDRRAGQVLEEVGAGGRRLGRAGEAVAAAECRARVRPPPPATDGNGNQPICDWQVLVRSSGRAIVPGSQSPCSSIAALPLATMPAELPAPCCAGVPRKPDWNGLAARKRCRSLPALVQHGSSSFERRSRRFIVPPSIRGPRSSPSRTRPATCPCCRWRSARCRRPCSLATSALSSSMVVGGAVMPALANRSLLYQNRRRAGRTGCRTACRSTCQPWRRRRVADPAGDRRGDVHDLARGDLAADRRRRPTAG